jgi:endonuclease YncB( thermonuclease family)
VTGVLSGDTIMVRDAAGQPHRVRLFGTAAPQPSQPFASESTQNLEALVLGKVVNVRTLGTNLDSGDSVAMVYYGDEYVNLDQIAAGMARNYVEDGLSLDLAEAESEAMAEGRGIWSIEYPDAP